MMENQLELIKERVINDFSVRKTFRYGSFTIESEATLGSPHRFIEAKDGHDTIRIHASQECPAWLEGDLIFADSPEKIDSVIGLFTEAKEVLKLLDGDRTAFYEPGAFKDEEA